MNINFYLRKTKNFCDLYTGEVFLGEEDEVYMKTTTVIDENGGTLNAVNLSDGYLVSYDLDEKVVAVDAVVEIGKEK